MSNRRSKTVFVGNLPYDASEDELRELFSQVGPIETRPEIDVVVSIVTKQRTIASLGKRQRLLHFDISMFPFISSIETRNSLSCNCECKMKNTLHTMLQLWSLFYSFFFDEYCFVPSKLDSWHQTLNGRDFQGRALRVNAADPETTGMESANTAANRLPGRVAPAAVAAAPQAPAMNQPSQESYEVLLAFKSLLHENFQTGHQLLLQNPALAEALYRMMLELNLMKPTATVRNTDAMPHQTHMHRAVPSHSAPASNFVQPQVDQYPSVYSASIPQVATPATQSYAPSIHLNPPVFDAQTQEIITFIGTLTRREIDNLPADQRDLILQVMRNFNVQLRNE